MMKTAKQIALSIGRAERCVLLAIRKMAILPDETRQHAGKLARYYSDEAQARIIQQATLSRSAKIKQNGPTVRKKPIHTLPSREEWTYWYIAQVLSISPRGAKTLLALHGYDTIEAFIHSSFALEDVRAWYNALPGDTPYLKGRSLVSLRRARGMAARITKEKMAAAQARIVSKYDPSEWATRQQASEFLGYNDTSTYQIYKNAGLRFLKDHAVRLYSWEDLRTLKTLLLQKRGNLSNLAEVMRARLLQEGYDFTEEKTFAGLVNKKPLRYDYCIPSARVLIEVQGSQHFSSGYQGFAAPLPLDDVQARDRLKHEFANSHGWDLLWVTALDDVSDVIDYLRSSPIGKDVQWSKELVEDYGEAALARYDGNAPRFCWLHRGHFPFHRAGMELKRIHKSYWSSAPGGAKSPRDTWATRKSAFQRLVENRQKYHPSLDALDLSRSLPSLSMLVAGFGVAKISPPASFFSPSLGRELIQGFVVGHLIVDPFAGFSGRMLAAAQEGKAYRGFDVSTVRVAEAQEVIAFYGLREASVEQADASLAPFTEWGNEATLLTCPPYGDKESWDGVTGYEKEDYWIDQVLRHHGCARYVFVVGATEQYKQYVVLCSFKKHHPFYTKGSRQVIVIDRKDRDLAVGVSSCI